MFRDDYSPKMEIDKAAEICERIKFSLRYPEERNAIETLLSLAFEKINEKGGARWIDNADSYVCPKCGYRIKSLEGK
ncbi:MAG: hypothetical protein J6I68_00115 [Butyrivibrio sp.]|uniref:hypothetical protein n=1 Tax=Butyrivibrio sp. TaxID=28121 RepID=UPI001B556B0E|nr:hypothetical protein [Butyrivibrio sp.]MBP3781632.1 hypothetical protein [Butyrivibrio sp.]